VQDNFQFTHNNYHPQIIAFAQADKEKAVGKGEKTQRGKERGWHAQASGLARAGVLGRGGEKQKRWSF
jgi:hypothetical protein